MKSKMMYSIWREFRTKSDVLDGRETEFVYDSNPNFVKELDEITNFMGFKALLGYSNDMFIVAVLEVTRFDWVNKKYIKFDEYNPNGLIEEPRKA